MFLEGKVIFIDEPKDVSKTDREFITSNIGIDVSVVINGTPYENFATMQATNDRAKDLFKEVNVGDKIRAFFSIKGVIKKKDDLQPSQKNPESKSGFNNLNLYKWEILERDATATQPQAPSQAPANQDSSNLGNSNNPNPEQKDNLPF